MGSLTSTLTMRLVDDVSAPARLVAGALGRVDQSAKRATGTSKAILSGRGGAFLAGGGSMIATTVGGYVAGQQAKEAYSRFAYFDRRMTRIRQTSDATIEEGKRAEGQIRQTADGIGLGIDETTKGVEALVAAGRSLPEAMAFLPAVAKTAQAAGAEVEDIAKTADAIGTSMGIGGPRMQDAFDILVKAGKAGKFELKDMAGELPSLAAAAGAAGLKGTDGLKKLAAMLQIIRNQTGSSSEAATAMSNVFQKMETEETATKFKKFGIDLRKEMVKARKEGKDLTEVFFDLAEQAVKGDLSKLPQLFADAQFLQGVWAILSQRDALRSLFGELGNARGAVERDLKAPAGDAAAAIQRLSNAWDNALRSFGKAADAAGITTFLQLVSKTADGAATDFERLGKLMQDVRNLSLGDAAKGAATFLAGRTDEERRTIAQREARRIAMAMDEEQKHGQKLIAERKRLDGSLSKYPTGSAPAVLTAQSNAVDKAIAEETDRLREVMGQLGAKLNSLVTDLVPPLSRGLDGPPDIPQVPTREPLKPGQLPPPPGSRPRQASVEAPLLIQLDDASATSAANAARSKVQAILDANPVTIRAKVDTSGISYGLGGKVSDGVNGSLGDNGGRR